MSRIELFLQIINAQFILLQLKMKKVLSLLYRILLRQIRFRQYQTHAELPSEWVAPLVNSDITLADIVAQYQENIDALLEYDLY